ncbi:MAG TPA: hypothetical protein VF092_09515 [Longimicrobium sp.]
MRASSRIAASVVLLLPLLTACGGSQPEAQQASVATAFTDQNAPAGEARPAQESKPRTDIDECRKQRQQGADSRARNFPCEAFLGE